jgi:hypothetical protein
MRGTCTLTVLLEVLAATEPSAAFAKAAIPKATSTAQAEGPSHDRAETPAHRSNEMRLASGRAVTDACIRPERGGTPHRVTNCDWRPAWAQTTFAPSVRRYA